MKRMCYINKRGDCYAYRAYRTIQKELSATNKKRMMVMNEGRMRVSGKSWERFAGPHFHEKLAYAGASERYPPLPHFTGFVNIVHNIYIKSTHKVIHG